MDKQEITNDEALGYLFGCAMTKYNISDYEEKKVLECADILKQDIDDLELYKKALNYVAYCICYNINLPAKKNNYDRATQLEIKNYIFEQCLKQDWNVGNNIIENPKNYEVSND